MGDTVESALGSKITVYGWTTDVPTRQGNQFITPRPGTVFSQAAIKMCPKSNSSEPTYAADLAPSFSLVMSDQTVIPPDNVGYNGEVQGNNAIVGPNQCVKGPVIFESPQGQKPKFVQFASSSIIQWRVGG